MGKLQATAGVHWLTGSTSHSLDEVQYVLGRLGRPERPGGYGHPFKRIHESGTAVYCGSDVPGARIVINAPGEVCESWSPQITHWLCELSARCTRLDVAMDVHPPELARQRIAHMHRAFKLGRCETSLRKGSMSIYRSEGEGEGWTLYLGKPSSEVLIRAYDRRGPLRIETQWRPQGDAREVVPELLAKKGPAAMWRRCAKRVRFELPWYRQLLEGDDVEELPTDDRGASVLEEAMFQLYKQQGLTLWMLGLLGFGLDDLRQVPDQLRGSQVAKYRTSLAARGRQGHDVTNARADLEER